MASTEPNASIHLDIQASQPIPPHSLKWFVEIHIFVVTTISCVGLLGNTCQLIVTLRSSLFNQTSGVYLIFLSVLDNVNLCFHLFYSFLDLRDTSDFFCKLTMITGALFAALSWIILVCMTIDRCYMCFVQANSGKLKPRRKTALMICIISVTVTMLYYSLHEGIMFGLVTDTPSDTNMTSNISIYKTYNVGMVGQLQSIARCNLLPEYSNYLLNFHMPVDTFGWRILAPLIVTICNISIIRFLKKYWRFVTVNKLATSRQIHENKITRMLMVISLCYVTSILPSGVYFVSARFIYDDFSEIVSMENPVFLLIHDILVLNHCINFFLYILSARRFRHESKLIFKSVWKTFVRIILRNRTQSTSSIELHDL